MSAYETLVFFLLLGLWVQVGWALSCFAQVESKERPMFAAIWPLVVLFAFVLGLSRLFLHFRKESK